MTIESFNVATGGNSLYLARFDAVAERVSAALAADGLTLNAEDREALKSLGGVKIAVFGDEPLDQSVLAGAMDLPGVRAQLHQRAVAQQLAQPDSDLHADLSRMSPAARLTYARQLDSARAAQQAANPPAGLTAEEEAAAIKMIRMLPPAAKISAARAMGLA
mgnify:CR=1 FL=1